MNLIDINNGELEGNISIFIDRKNHYNTENWDMSYYGERLLDAEIIPLDVE